VLFFAFFLFACQQNAPASVTILDQGTIRRVEFTERTPLLLLSQAGITLGPEDQLLVNGLPIRLDQSITKSPITRQIRRAETITLVTPGGEKNIKSSASTVGEALTDASIWLREGDKILPAAS